MEPFDLTGVKEYASEIAQPLRDRLVEAIDIVPFGYADTLRGQAEAEENEAFE